MGNSNFNHKLQVLQQQISGLQQRVAAGSGQFEEILPELFEKLHDCLEELQGADEALRQQRENFKIRERQQASIAKLGQRALAGVDLPALMDEAVELVSETLEIEYCQILELLPDVDTLRLRAGWGWPAELIGQATTSVDANSQMGYTLLSGEPVIVEELPAETRFNGPSLLYDRGVVSGMSVIIDGQAWPFGVLGAHTTKRRIFSGDDINFLQAIANVLAQAIEPKGAEEALEESEERYRRLLELSFETIAIYSLGRFVYVNPSGAKFYGVNTAGELIGKPIADFIRPEHLEIIEAQEPEIGGVGQELPLVEETLTRFDGTRVNVEIAGVPTTYQGRPAMQVVVRNITDRKRAEQEILELNRKLLALQHAGATIASSLDLQYVLTTVTEAMVNLLEVTGCAISEWDQTSGTISVIAEYGSSGKGSHQMVYDLANYPVTKQVLLERYAQQMTFRQADLGPAQLTYMQAINIKTLLILPMEFQDRVVGLAEVMDDHIERTFRPDEIALTQLLANQAASAIENARLYDQARREIAERMQAEEALRQAHDELEQRVEERTAELSTLTKSQARLLTEMESVLTITRALVSEVSLNKLLEFIISQAKYLTDVAGAAVLLLSDDGQSLEVATPGESLLQMQGGSKLPVEGSLAGLAITRANVQISNQAQDDERTASIRALLPSIELRSLLCAPLVVQGKSLGVLLMWNKQGQEFTKHDDRLMSLFADQAALALHNAHIHARNRQMAIEQERHRLGRELHDSVTQSLYSIALAAQTLLKLLDQKDARDKLRDILENIQSFSQTGLAEIRAQLYNLHPPALTDKGLVKALLEHCDVLMGQHALSIELRAAPELLLSMYQQEGLYYIAREALWNIAKHAAATHVDISLVRADDQTVLSIIDDGVGFDPSTVADGSTMGLRNMEERAELLGGLLELQSGTGQGTRVTTRIPNRWP